MSTQKSNRSISDGIKIVSPSLPQEQAVRMLAESHAFTPHGHFQYPLSEGSKEGSHLGALFLIEPIVREPQFVEWIVDDIARWIEAQELQFELIFAPAQAAVDTIVRALAQRVGARVCFWEYVASGWLGARVVEGKINPGDRVLVFNGVSLRGDCIGGRLPTQAQKFGGVVVGAAVFAKGTASAVQEAEEKFGENFYAAIEVDIPVMSPAECSLCKQNSRPVLVPWTAKRKG